MRHVERDIERMFSGRRHRAPKVYSHLRDCASCAEYYRRFAEAERALCGADASADAFAAERIGQGLGSAPATKVAKPVFWTLGSLAVAGLCALVLGVPRTGEETLTARGPYPTEGPTRTGFRVFQIDGQLSELRPDEPAPDVIYLSLTNAHEVGCFVSVVVGQGDAATVAISNHALGADAVDAPLLQPVALDRFEGSPVVLTVVFSRSPMSPGHAIRHGSVDDSSSEESPLAVHRRSLLRR